MRDCRDDQVRAALAERIRRLTPDARPRWGAMSAGRMLVHLIDALRIGYGEQEPGVPDPPVPRILRSSLGRWLVIDSPLPWPKGRLRAPAAWHVTEPADFEDDRRRLLRDFDRIAEPRERWGVSPALGELTPAQWGRLTTRHLDHHLRQFGC